ncbi:hypothetical protein vBOeSunk162_25 [Oenococcus phage vB_OeS_unk162]|nr:hypothetical protein vBOeSunk162_25 [Oenococcus phage vB_OeS_unk162]
MNYPSESVIQKQSIQALKTMGYTVYRSNSGNGGNYHIQALPKGFSDCFGYDKSGRYFEIEFKDHRGKPRDVQIENHERLTKDHIIHGLARSPEEAIKIVTHGLIGFGF